MRISHSTAEGGESHSHEIPSFGLGVFLMSEPGECKSACLAALAAGYTHIDTARAYGNEHEVGEALNEAGVNREDVFITTKLRRMHATGFEEVWNIVKNPYNISIQITSIYTSFMRRPRTVTTEHPYGKEWNTVWNKVGSRQSASQIMGHTILRLCGNMRPTSLQ